MFAWPLFVLIYACIYSSVPHSFPTKLISSIASFPHFHPRFPQFSQCLHTQCHVSFLVVSSLSVWWHPSVLRTRVCFLGSPSELSFIWISLLNSQHCWSRSARTLPPLGLSFQPEKAWLITQLHWQCFHFYGAGPQTQDLEHAGEALCPTLHLQLLLPSLSKTSTQTDLPVPKLLSRSWLGGELRLRNLLSVFLYNLNTISNDQIIRAESWCQFFFFTLMKDCDSKAWRGGDNQICSRPVRTIARAIHC